MQYTVYQIEGDLSPLVYIGYHVKNDVDTIAHFVVGATRSEDRKDVEFYELQGGLPDGIRAVVLSEEDNEWEAFNKRNELRASIRTSFTGPSRWPLGAYERAQKESDVSVQQPFDMWKARQSKTARGALELKLWTFDQMKVLAERVTRPVVLKDLDTLTPDAFATKYQL